MKEFSIKQIIVKYLASEATAIEKAELYRWIESKKNQKIFKEFLKAQQLIDFAYKAQDTEAAFNDFLEKIHKDKKVFSLKPYFKYAAIVIVVVSAILYVLNNNTTTTPKAFIDSNEISLQMSNGENEYINIIEDKVITTNDGVKIGVVKNGVLKYLATNNIKEEKISYQNILKVPYGKTFRVILSDGSSIQLNSGSVLKYPSTFIKNKPREVFLDGEAFFKVTKNTNSPFLVSSIHSITKVYGTEFNVSNYLDANTTEIVLVEGSVGVKQKSKINDRKPFELITPSQKASLANNADAFEITEVDVQKYIGWTNGFLIFENDELTDILKKLERHYNVQIINNYKEINKLRFNGSFQKDSIEKILNTIKTHTNFSYQREGDRITIYNPKTTK